MRNHIAIGPRATTMDGPDRKNKEPVDKITGNQATNNIEKGSLGKDEHSTSNLQSTGKLAMGAAPIPTTFCWVQSREEITSAVESVLDCIDIASNRYHIHRDRIFIAGYDGGGTMALRIALENPQIFAGAISLGGSLPRGLNLLRRINEARKLPLLIANSLDSHKYLPKQACEDLRLLHAAGFSLDLRQYPCGDELTTKMLSDMDQWIMNRFC
jgi:predicted esterase